MSSAAHAGSLPVIKQLWSSGASIPVPLACGASDLPIDLLPQNGARGAHAAGPMITHPEHQFSD